MKKFTLSIFTPTYNRAYTLPKLYESLKRQTSKDFEWIIVDDGSVDNTRQLIEGWMDEGVVPIKYEYQQNAGKMSAHNRGVEMANTELFVCIDSDDYIVDEAVELIITKWSSESDKKTLAGIIAYRSMRQMDGNYEVICEFPHSGYDKLYLLYKKGFRGETTLIFRTDAIRPFPFPIFEGEKFIPETIMYDQLDLRYDWALLDKALTLCEYMSDGYTKNGRELYNRNPKGVAYLYNEHSKMPGLSIIDRIRLAALYITYSREAKCRSVYSNSNTKGLLYFAALILSKRYE